MLCATVLACALRSQYPVTLAVALALLTGASCGLLNGLLITAYALDGLAHAVEALCGHAIGARDRLALKRSLIVAGLWSLLASLLFALAFALGGHLFVNTRRDEVLRVVRAMLASA